MRLLRKITAIVLAVSMVAPSVLGTAVQAYAADAAAAPTVTEYLSDNLEDADADKAAGMSGEYWETEAPADVQEAAQMYAEDAADGKVEFDARGAEEVADGEAKPGAKGAEDVPLEDMQVTAAEKKYEDGLRETAHHVRVTYTIANRKYLKAKTIDGMFDSNMDAFLASMVATSPVYESKEHDGCYVAFLNYGSMNGLSDRIVDAEFVTNTQENPKDVSNDVVFDKKTGIVYIPKSYYFAADGTELGYDLQAQVLVAPELEKGVEVNVSVENHSAAKSVLKDGTAEFTAFNSMTFPLVAEEDAGKVNFEDIEVYLNDSALPADLEEGEGASYNGKTGEYTLNCLGATTYSVKFVIKGKTLSQRIRSLFGAETVHAAKGAVNGETMSYVTNVDTGKPITPSIEFEKLKVGNVYEYNGSNSTHKYEAYREMLYAGQKNFVYAPYLSTDGTSSDREKFYNYLTVADDENAKSLDKLIENVGDIVAAKDQNPSAGSGGGAVNQDKKWEYWYMFGIGAPSGTLNEVHGRGAVSFGKASEWRWSGSFEYDGETRYRNLYVGMCCHVGDDLVEGEKKNQVSVLEKGDGYVVLGLAQTAAGTGLDDQAGATIIKVMTSGKAMLKKVSSAPAVTDGNKCYSLEGAQYGVYSDAGCTKLVATLTTNAKGESGEIELPAGKYWAKETKASPGYLLDEGVHGSYTVKSGETATITVQEDPGNDPINIVLNKLDSVTGAFTQGGAELAGAEFTIKYYDGYYNKENLPGTAKKTWIIKTVKQEDGTYRANMNVPECKVGGDDYYTDAVGNIILPLGTVTIQETKEPAGYLLEGSVLKNTTTGEIINDGGIYLSQVVQDANGGDAHLVGGGNLVGGNRADRVEFQINEVVKRGDIMMRKLDAETQKKMAGVEFRLTNTKTGESHTFVTDENGEYSTESAFAKHSHNTNKGGDGDGIWFSQTEGGGEAPVDDSLGALQYGEYRIEEIPGENNAGKVMFEDTFKLSRDGYTINLNSVENHDGIAIMTVARDKATGTHYAHAGEGTALIDTVQMENLKKGTAYKLVAKLVDAATGEEILKADGTPVTGEAEFKALTTSRTVEVKLDEFDSAALEGKTAVIYEYLYDTATGEEAARHEDPEDKDQMVHFAQAISTDAQDVQTGTHVGSSTKLKDIVSYKGLEPGEKYTLKASLVNKETGEAEAEGSSEFTAETEDGKAEVLLDAPAEYKGKTYVFYEELYYGDALLADHKDLSDEGQSIHYPEIGTKAADGLTKTQIGAGASGKTTIIDTVEYKNLIPGQEYTITGVLMDKETGKEFAQKAEEKSIFDKVADFFTGGDKVVDKVADFFTGGDKAEDKAEDKSEDKAEDKAEDKSEDKAEDKSEDKSEDKAEDKAEDKSEDKSEDKTEDKSEDKAQELTSSVTFTPEKADGTVELAYEVGTEDIQGRTLVVFEDLIVKGVVVTSHADIEDEGQSVYYPGVKTTAVDTKTQEHVSEHSKTATITDRVEYTNLLAGHEYTVTGKLMDQSTGEPLLDKDGKEHIASVTFKAGSASGYETLKAQDGSEYFHVFDGVDGNFYFKAVDGKYLSCDQYGADVENPVSVEETQVKAEKAAEGKTVSGSVDLVYTVDATLLTGKTVVVFEDLYYEDVKIATHSDIKDEAQSVHTPEIRTNATVDGKHAAKASGKTKIVDKVTYENLVPGLEYTVTGTLMDKKTGEAVDAETKPVTFTPEAASGSVDIEFIADTRGSSALVAFEELTCKGTLVAQHKDLKDKDQTVTFKKGTKGTKGAESVQTGDYIMGIVLLLIAGAAAGLIGIRLRKKK